MPELMSAIDDRVLQWLESCDQSTTAGHQQSSPQQLLNPSSKSIQERKRRRQSMDEDTPRAKKVARGIATPSTSAISQSSSAHQVVTTILRPGPSTSESSSLTTSRSSSPSKKSKRRRESEIEFSRPAIVFHNRIDSKLWKEKNIRDVPLAQNLLEAISAKNIDKLVGDVSMTNELHHKLERIQAGIGYCKDRSGNEDAWCDKVIYPALMLASESLNYKEEINIHNVKSIDVDPIDLLPTNAQRQSVSKKRVDYTVGIDIADRDESFTLLRELEDHTITQCPDKMLRDQALCCHVEVKTRRSPDDARFQLSTWCTAGFQKQENLWLQRHNASISPQPPTPHLAPAPLLLWQENHVQVWIAVMDSANAKVYILEEREFSIDENDTTTLLRLIVAIGAIMKWGGEDYKPWLREFVGLENE